MRAPGGGHGPCRSRGRKGNIEAENWNDCSDSNSCMYRCTYIHIYIYWYMHMVNFCKWYFLLFKMLCIIDFVHPADQNTAMISYLYIYTCVCASIYLQYISQRVLSFTSHGPMKPWLRASRGFPSNWRLQTLPRDQTLLSLGQLAVAKRKELPHETSAYWDL